jgi:hypothetical protein
MTKVPRLEDRCPDIANGDLLDVKLAGDEAALIAEARTLTALQGKDKNRPARAEMIVAGETPGPELTTPQLEATLSRLGDVRFARKLLRDKQKAIRLREGTRLCLELKPAYDAIAAKFAENLVSVFNFLVEQHQMQSSLMGQDIPFFPHVCNLDTVSMFGSPADPGSAIAILMRECVERGYLNHMPKLPKA